MVSPNLGDETGNIISHWRNLVKTLLPPPLFFVHHRVTDLFACSQMSLCKNAHQGPKKRPHGFWNEIDHDSAVGDRFGVLYRMFKETFITAFILT